MANKDLIARRNTLLGPAYRLFYDEPLQLVRGQGLWLYDAEGNAYLDAYNNVPGVGHSHPRVAAAICEQVQTLNIHTRYLHETIVEYAERLQATLPAELGQVMFTCSGSEANDLALRIARHNTGATGVIATDLAYHGSTLAVAQISPSLGTPPGPQLRTVGAPDPYRHPDCDIAARLADDVSRAIDSLNSDGMRPCALICDTIFSSDGVFADPAGFLAPAVERVRAAGGLFIADEVQAGFARTGDCFWGFQRHGVVPDIVTMGKPMGNGYPVAGLAVRPAVVRSFGAASRYFNTFGGSPVAAAAGLAVLDVIEEEQLQQHARTVGHYLRQQLRLLSDRHPLIGDVRGAGLFTAVELVRNRNSREPATEETAWIVNEMRRRRVLIGSTGAGANCLKIRPPLPFTTDHADQLTSLLDEVMQGAASLTA